MSVPVSASPATIGLGAFLTSLPNWVDVVAILPFYVDLFILLSGSSGGSDVKIMQILRIVRLSRIMRVLKFSKALSGVIVLGRTLVKSMSAMSLIVVISLIMCVFWASVLMATKDLGTFVPDPALVVPDGSGKPGGMYTRDDGSPSEFSNIFETFWWCFQTLTSEGYGVPWVPISWLGKCFAVCTALVGTIVLALPIAVVGARFDDEWARQAKVNKFAAVSCGWRPGGGTPGGCGNDVASPCDAAWR